MSVGVVPDLEQGEDVRIRVLGSLQAWRNGMPVPLGPGHQRAVLALLAAHANTPLHRDAIVDAIWGGAPPASSTAVIQTYVSRLRRILDPHRRLGRRDGLLTSDGPHYQLKVSGNQLDLLAFRELLYRARSARDAGQQPEACDAYEDALNLWEDEPFADVYQLHDHPAVAGVSRDRAEAVVEFAKTALAADWPHRVLPHLYALLDREPLNERAYACLMIALAAGGQHAAALAVYDRACRRLADELGLDPGPELAEAHVRVLRHQVPSERAGPAEVIAPAADELVEPPPSPGIVPRQLPAVVPVFAGRSAELAALSGVSRQAGSIAVISGTAGVGKTTLAVYWAHQVAEQFPDGQLYTNLRGSDPSGKPATAAEAIRGFLDILGVEPGRIPAGLDQQASLYRSLLVGRKVLVVLDNARDPEQVRPLLPGSVGGRVVITSRSPLIGLLATEGARSITLDVLTRVEARDLLVGRLGPERLECEPGAVDELIELCARLPLALGIVAARASINPDHPLAVLASELRDSRGRLDVLDAGDAVANVRATFLWSYQQLSSAAARMFRLLGIHPGPDITASAAAALAGLPARTAAGLLAELTKTNLLTEQPAGRFAFHDLLRAYAAERALADGDDQGMALQRVLDHYLRSVHSANQLLYPNRDPLTLLPPRPDVVPDQLAGKVHAQTWLRAERRVLLAAIARAAELRMDTYAWQIPYCLAMFLDLGGYWNEAAKVHDVALQAAERLGDTRAQARIHLISAYVDIKLSSASGADAHLRSALLLYRSVGDRVGQARIYLALSKAFCERGNYRDGVAHAQYALILYWSAGRAAGMAMALDMVGWNYAHLGKLPNALSCCRRALAMHREAGYRLGEAGTWDSLGYIRNRLGHDSRAATCYEHAVAAYREDAPIEAACVQIRLGDVYLDIGRPEQAREAWQEALAVLDEARHTRAALVRQKLDHLCGVDRLAGRSD